MRTEGSRSAVLLGIDGTAVVVEIDAAPCAHCGDRLYGRDVHGRAFCRACLIAGRVASDELEGWQCVRRESLRARAQRGAYACLAY